MEGLVAAVGGGIGSVVHGAFDGIGGALRSIVASLNASLPIGVVPIAVFVLLVAGMWAFAKR